jgi:thiosulfate/3-mercaptopyruvate sulfurtransferase
MTNVRFSLALGACFYVCAAVFSIAGELGIDPTAVPRLTPANKAPAPDRFSHPAGLVDPTTLAKWVNETDVKTIVIDGRDASAFKLGHIPSARNIQSDLFQDPTLPPFYLPPSKAIAFICKQEGISADSRVVIYDEEDGRLAARIWFTLHAYGHDHVSILNGGVAKWREEKRGWNATLPVLDGAGSFTPKEPLRGCCGYDDLPQFRVRVKVLGQLPNANVLDARARSEYMGDEVRGKSGGHIPGAVNLPWQTLMMGSQNTRVWRSPQEIHAILRLANVDKDFPIAIYDQAGGRSAHLYFTLWMMGYDNIRNYVGGWREYGNRDEAEIEK